MSLVIGSGDIPKLIMGRNTKGYRDLWQKFISTNPPHYNSFASPIDALRTGAILERAYLDYVGEDYFFQVKQTCSSNSVLTVSLDFAKFDKGNVCDFDELKTMFLPDYINIIKPLLSLNQEDQQEFIKRKFKNNYFQIQSQLLACNLSEANMVFLSVESYEDEVNKSRIIQHKDVCKFRIKADLEAIEIIENRLEIFQSVKDDFRGD